MEISVQKSDFLKAIALVGGVTALKNQTIPILGNILIETSKDETLKVVGTDLEIGISTQIPVKITKEGSITVPSKKLHEIIRELPEGQIEITVGKNNAVNIKAGKGYFKILGLPKEDYPKLPEYSQKDAIEIPQAIMRDGLTLTFFAISRDETRYVLNGVLVSIKENKICFVATDGRRLAFIDKPLAEKQKNFEMILPSKTVQELLKVLTWDGNVKMIPLQNQVVFEVGETTIVSRLIEGHFPNYEQVIPKDEKTLSKANREEFLQAMRRTALLTSIESPAVKLDFVKGKILISSRSPNLGEAKEEFNAEVNGDEIAIGFNPHYLIDVLKNLDVENISFSLTEPDKPGLIRGKDGYLYVIMPMQLN
ncbi:MAG: DNA polymerase III subunit beta [Candidatus Omnitrophica bacterium]|nr:DNA polymerase III subunit beta [Candidatus Omnitrophota bacterium]